MKSWADLRNASIQFVFSTIRSKAIVLVIYYCVQGEKVGTTFQEHPKYMLILPFSKFKLWAPDNVLL